MTIQRLRLLPGFAVLLIGLTSFAAPQARVAIYSTMTASSGAWTVYHHDDGHTGTDSSLPPVVSVTTGWVSPVLDGEVYAEPLVYGGVVFTATLNNTVYAINQVTGLTIWSKNLGVPQASGWVCGNVAPMGILGTPVIDTAASRIYAVAEIAGPTVGSPPAYRLFGLDLATGTIALNVLIAPSGFDWKIHQERGALALANGNVYVPFGGRVGYCFDGGGTIPYYGYVVAVSTSGIGVPPVF